MKLISVRIHFILIKIDYFMYTSSLYNISSSDAKLAYFDLNLYCEEILAQVTKAPGLFKMEYYFDYNLKTEVKFTKLYFSLFDVSVKLTLE